MEGLSVSYIPLIDCCNECQIARKSVASAVGPGATKRIRHYQELESRVLLLDLLEYGDRAIKEYEAPEKGPRQYVPENHWFYLIRRFVCSSAADVV